MDSTNLQLAKNLLSATYVQQGQQALSQRHNLVKQLLSNRHMPEDGWDDANIESLLQDLSLMDSNNFLDNVGMGEREARCASKLVLKRHYGMAHGIGRSGSITDEQPKAGGSTILAKLTTAMVKDALEIAGLKDIGALSVLPIATGMTLMLALIALKKKRPPTARYVLWPRMDQKSCIKSILTAGLQLVVIPNRLEGHQLRTDVAAIQAKIAELGSDQIVCVLTTTSCFAPRAPDRVEEVAKLCQQAGVGHIINNAYGVQCAGICRSITSAWRRGRVDAVVQSTDKNFMVPVGGAVLAAGARDSSLVEAVNRSYPGRASLDPILDVFITLLGLGAKGWRRILADREETYSYLKQRLEQVAEAQGEQLLHTPDNPISLALTLTTLDPCAPSSDEPADREPLKPPIPQIKPPVSPPLEDAPRPDAGAGKPLHAAAASSTLWGDTPPASVAVDPAAQLSGDASGTPVGAEGLASTNAVGEEGGSSRGRGANDGARGERNRVGGAAVKKEDPGGTARGPGGSEGATSTGRKAAPGLTFFGSMLFARCVSGTRVIPTADDKAVEGIPFAGFGSSYDRFPYPYMTAAAAIGATCGDVDTFLNRLERCFADFRKKSRLPAKAVANT